MNPATCTVCLTLPGVSASIMEDATFAITSEWQKGTVVTLTVPEVAQDGVFLVDDEVVVRKGSEHTLG